MSIKEIMESNHKTYLVYVNGFDRRGKRIQMKRRGIKSKREAEIVEFELKRQLAEMKERPVSYTWDEWFKVCVERMRVEMKPTTILNYTGKNTIWLKPFLKGKDLKTITARDKILTNSSTIKYFVSRVMFIFRTSSHDSSDSQPINL